MFMQYDMRSAMDRAPAENGTVTKVPHNQGYFVAPGAPLAMVYAPRQVFEGIYNVQKALEQGTIFEALDKPFLPGRRQEEQV